MNNKKINSGMYWTIGPQILSYASSLAFTAILSRMISPFDYGLIDMVSTVTAFFMIFADGGLAWSVLQRKNITIDEVNNLFWVNTSAGFILTALCIISAPTVALFYGYNELTFLMIAMSLNFVFTGISILGTAWLKRKLEFKKLAIADYTALIIAGFIGILLAKIGWGYWALAIMSLLKSGVRTILVLGMTRETIGKYKKNTSITSLLSFGFAIQAYSLIGYLYKNIDSVTIGKIWGSEELALYSKSLFLMNLPSMLTVGALGGYMVSLLSRHQDDPFTYHALYLRCIRIVLTISYPVSLFFVVFPYETISFLYGNNWTKCTAILEGFAGALILLPIYSTVSWLFLSHGKGRTMITWSLLSATLYLAAIYLSIDLGASRVANAYSLVMLILTVITLTYSHYINKMNILLTVKEIANSALIPLLGIAAVKALSLYFTIETSHLFVLTYGITSVFLTILFLFIRYRSNIKTALLMSVT